jgi:hypothetical protein
MAQGVLNQSSMVWKEGLPNWVSVAQLSQSSNRPANDNIPTNTSAAATNSLPKDEPVPVQEQVPVDDSVPTPAQAPAPASSGTSHNTHNPELAHLGTQGIQESQGLHTADNSINNQTQPIDSNIQWFYAANGQSVGPMTTKDLHNKFETKELGPETMVWHANMTSWTPASQILELKPAFEIKQDLHGSKEPQNEEVSSSPSVMRKSRFLSQDEGDTGSYTPKFSPPEPTNQQNMIRPGAIYFYVIAGLTLLVAFLTLSSGSKYSSNNENVMIGLAVYIILAITFTAMGIFGRRNKWVYIAGIVLYGLDTIATIATFNMIASGVHLLFLAGLIRGFFPVPEQAKIAKSKPLKTR